MGKEIDIIKRLFSDNYLNNSSSIIREESENMERQIRSRTISEDNIVIYRLDQNERGIDPFPFIKRSKDGGFKGMRRICDFVIFVSHNESVFALLIEMKKGNGEAKEQLNVSAPLIQFIFNRAEVLNHLKSKLIIRKIGITDKPGKRNTADRGEIYYDESGYVKQYCGKYLHIEKFLH